MKTVETELAAGRELDALVAERVMGWWCEDDNPYWLGSDFECYKEVNRNAFPDPRDMQQPWSPSTSIAAAWEVVEKMIEQGFDEWMVSNDEVYFEDSSTAPDLQASASNITTKYLFGAAIPGDKVAIPHAICLAALKARC